MTTTIGRAVFQNAPAAAPSWDGDTLTLRININASSLEQARALIQQVQGLANNADEPVVPVTSTDEPTLDGFYVVLGVNVEPPRTYRFNNAPIPCTIGLQRVTGGFSFPQQEILSVAVTRTNTYSAGGGAIVAWSPDITPAVDQGITVSATASIKRTRACADAPTSVAYYLASPTRGAATWSRWVPPAKFYWGAARVEINVSGTWYVVAGRQIAVTDNWRISNGIARLTAGDGATRGTIEVWTGSAWESREIQHTDASGGLGLDIGLAYDTDRSPAMIIRNSPEGVVVRCSSGGVTVDYSILPGAMTVAFSYTTPAATTPVGGIALTAAQAAACTDLTYGIRATADDANGNRIVMSMAPSYFSDLVNGRVWSTANRASGFVGLSLNGAAAVAGDVPQQLSNEFIGVGAMNMRVVTR